VESKENVSLHFSFKLFLKTRLFVADANDGGNGYVEIDFKRINQEAVSSINFAITLLHLIVQVICI
jgi:hypothetical protein